MPGYRSEKRRSVKTAGALLACVALVAGAGFLRRPIEETQTMIELRRSTSGTGSLNLPPDIAFAQAGLGTFRALATTVLWSRASRLQREENYFESMRLADWITRLQPRFSKVWEFYATNMTYNISVATHTPQERWLWVQAGIEMLRKRGIPLNPGKANLYAELSRFFSDKIGGTNDEAHLYYKRQLAGKWHDLLGEPPAGSAQEKADWFRPVAEAYSSYIGSRGAKGALERLQENVKGTEILLREIRAMKIEPGKELLRLLAAQEAAEKLEDLGVEFPPADREFNEWVLKNRGAAPYRELLAFLRARALADDYGMEPPWMLRLMEKSGWDISTGKAVALSLDWRHPAAHALYWAELGLHRSRTMTKIDEFSVAQTRHYYRAALGELAMNGKLEYDRDSGYYLRSAQTDCIEAYRLALLDSARTMQSDAAAAPPGHDHEHPGHQHEPPPGTRRHPGAGHGHFLGWATRAFYFRGQRSLAGAYYERLRELVKKEPGQAPVPIDPGAALDDFIVATLVSSDGLGKPAIARPVVEQLLLRAVHEGYAAGQDTTAALFLSTGRKIHAACLAAAEKNTGANPLPPFEDLLDEVFARYLLNPVGNSPPPSTRSRTWKFSPRELRARVYRRVRGPLQAELKKLGMDAAAAFPPPAAR